MVETYVAFLSEKDVGVLQAALAGAPEVGSRMSIDTMLDLCGERTWAVYVQSILSDELGLPGLASKIVPELVADEDPDDHVLLYARLQQFRAGRLTADTYETLDADD